MNLAAPLLAQLPGPARRGAYRAQQAALRAPLQAAQVLLRALDRREAKAANATARRALEREYQSLLERDLENVEAGVYPGRLLFGMPLASYAWALPAFLADLPRVYGRSQRGAWGDVPEVDRERYPAYFRRAFHWQTDGYLSQHSARIYDVSVEFLFVGCGDVMRRQVIPPLARHTRAGRGRPLRILDVGCGTGRTLAQLGEALPDHRYFGVDLSPHYLALARKELSERMEVTLTAENAEALPFRDGWFDAVTSVYLFHELPRPTRRKVLAEMARVLRPGGLLVLEDSAQLAEAADLAVFLEGFASAMHEPYYRDYVRDDLAEIVAEAGFAVGSVERAWLSKVVAATRLS